MSDSRAKSDSMDIDDEDDDGQAGTAMDDPTLNNRTANSTATSSTTPRIDTTALPTGSTSHHSHSNSLSLSSPTSSPDEPAASVTYIPGAVLPSLTRYVGRLLDVRIAARYLSTRSKEVLTRQLWGGGDGGFYTDDSDAVCLLIHSGLQIVRANPPADVSGNGGVVMSVRVAEAREQYVATERNGLKSRSWVSKYHRLSLQVVSCDVTDNINATRSKATAPATSTTSSTTAPVSTAAVVVASAPVAPASSSAAAAAASATSVSAKKDKKELRQLKMLVVDKPAGSATSSGGYARVKATKRKYIPECSVSFGDDESAWLHYSLWAVSDRAVDESSWCSARLRAELLRLEGKDGRFELKREHRKGEKRNSTASAAAHSHNSNNNTSSQLHTASLPFASILTIKPANGDFDTYSWSAVRTAASPVQPASSGTGRRNGSAGGGSSGSGSGVEVVLGGLDWSELEWGTDGVRVRGREYKIDRVRWEKA